MSKNDPLQIYKDRDELILAGWDAGFIIKCIICNGEKYQYLRENPGRLDPLFEGEVWWDRDKRRHKCICMDCDGLGYILNPTIRNFRIEEFFCRCGCCLKEPCYVGLGKHRIMECKDMRLLIKSRTLDCECEDTWDDCDFGKPYFIRNERRFNILPTINPDLLQGLQALRNLVQVPIHVINGWRCPEHNEAVGGKSGSLHLKGMAADIKWNLPHDNIYLFSAQGMRREAQEIEHFRNGGIGVYLDDNYIHVDVGPQRRWTG